ASRHPPTTPVRPDQRLDRAGASRLEPIDPAFSPAIKHDPPSPVKSLEPKSRRHALRACEILSPRTFVDHPSITRHEPGLAGSNTVKVLSFCESGVELKSVAVPRQPGRNLGRRVRALPRSPITGERENPGRLGSTRTRSPRVGPDSSKPV